MNLINDYIKIRINFWDTTRKPSGGGGGGTVPDNQPAVCTRSVKFLHSILVGILKETFEILRKVQK